MKPSECKFCECEDPLAFIGSFYCENCFKLVQSIVNEYNKYHCPLCGKAYTYGKQHHDLREHRNG